MKKFIKQSLLAVTVAAFTTVASAIPTTDTLANLLANNGSVGIGDKTFSGFTANSTFIGSGLVNFFDASQIIVTASYDSGIDTYFLTWGGQVMSLAGSGSGSADLLLGYTVTASAGKIVMIDQSYAGSAQYSGYASIAVDETVKSGVTVVANSHLEIGDLSDPLSEVGDDLNTLPGYSVLSVVKDINVVLIGSGTISISSVSQSFHQSGVPDGGMTVMLLGAALSGLAWANSRRKQ